MKAVAEQYEKLLRDSRETKTMEIRGMRAEMEQEIHCEREENEQLRNMLAELSHELESNRREKERIEDMADQLERERQRLRAELENQGQKDDN